MFIKRDKSGTVEFKEFIELLTLLRKAKIDFNEALKAHHNSPKTIGGHLKVGSNVLEKKNFKKISLF